MSVSARDEILKLQPCGKQIDLLREKKAEYSSWFFRFIITPSAMNSFLKIWEQFCDLSNLGSRIVARIDWGVCVCAIINGVVKLPLPLNTPARARTAKSSSVIT